MIDDRLLNEIADVMGKSCLSDLHSLTVSDLTIAVERIKAYLYSMEEWNYALSYILERDIKLADADALAQIDRLLHD